MDNMQFVTTEQVNALHEYMYEQCNKRRMQLELHWGCYGDENRFFSYTDNDYFSVDTKKWHFGHANSFDNLKQSIYFFIMLHAHQRPCGANRCAIFIEDIMIEDGFYRAVMGCKMFVDKSAI